MDDFPQVTGGPGFPSTCWTLVVAAGDRGTPEAAVALAELCRIYWYPLYAYIRSRGCRPEDAQDLTQEFFARLLEKGGLSAVDPHKGRFRSFLLACCQHFLANQREHARAAKRGGGRTPVSIDLDDAEGRYQLEPVDRLSPEILFERRWALTLVQQSRCLLEAEYREAGKADLFAPLLSGLMGEPAAPTYAETARSLGLSEAAVKKAAQRLRKRFAILLRRQVALTVADPRDVEDEVRSLMVVLGS